MSATITINTDQLSYDFFEGLKRMYPHKEVEITVQPADATEDILSNPAYASELMRRIEDYKLNGKTIQVKPEELL